MRSFDCIVFAMCQCMNLGLERWPSDLSVSACLVKTLVASPTLYEDGSNPQALIHVWPLTSTGCEPQNQN